MKRNLREFVCVNKGHDGNDNFSVSSNALVSSPLAGRLGRDLRRRLGLGELSASL
jgi:hypothetical protein